jgi:hypothetical protein
MRRQLIGWSAAVCVLTAFALGVDRSHSAVEVISGSAIILLLIIIATVSWHALSESYPHGHQATVRRLINA